MTDKEVSAVPSADDNWADGSNVQGRIMAARLFAVHELMRRDLAGLCQRFSSFAAGMLVDKAWAASLRHQGASFCGFVREHHSIEDSVILPTLRRTQGWRDPKLSEALARLEAEHHELLARLDEVTRTLAALPGDAGTRSAAAKALERLSERLHAHLRFEEESLFAALSCLRFTDMRG
jgi:iron-sulfur cluster repair protein YtfE (RIC family)